MLDLTKLEKCPTTTKVEPSDNIFTELGKNTYDYKDLLSELVDNSIAARRNDRLLLVTITIFVDEDNKPTNFIIKDNASGIAQERLGMAITPAGIQSPASLNEHGLGMKQAVAALGNLEYLATKIEKEPKARLVREFRFGDLETFYCDFDGDSGTEIAISNLKLIVVTHATSITRSLIPYLGARYRHFLRPDNRLLDLKLIIANKDSQKELYFWQVQEVKPNYFHPSTRTNKPVIEAYPLSGTNWEASLTLGYAPDDVEYDELGIDKPSKFHPYRVALSTQGLDIILHNRIVLFHQLSEIDVIAARHPDYNTIKGEINLLEGFSTAITKNSIVYDDNFRECITQVRRILVGEEAGPDKKKKNYLKAKTYPEQIPEKLLRDRLATWLSNNPIQKRTDVKTEYVVEGIEGFIDILADSEAWEIKTDQATALDVYQLFMYMDVGTIEKGFLVAKDFSTGATVAAQHIKEKHNKEIIFAQHGEFPITNPPNDNEREEYY